MKYIAVIFLFITFSSFATTWGESKVKDPIDNKFMCNVSEPMSSGSYIYRWPSKYDQVFWPQTTQKGIWYCEESGFIALIGDFEGLSDTEVTSIREYLRENEKPTDNISRLKHLENIYSLRQKDSDFMNRLKRILAYHYEKEGDLDTANNYRKLALEEINELAKGKIEEFTRLEYLYLSANYSRQLGDKKASDEFILTLKDVIGKITNEKLKGYGEYLSELVEDTKYIIKGGVLKPELPKKNA